MKVLAWALVLSGSAIQVTQGLGYSRNHVDNDYYVLHLAPTTSPEHIASHLGLVHEGPLGELPDHHVFHRPYLIDDDGSVDVVQTRLELRKRRLARRGEETPDSSLEDQDADTVLDGVLYSERQHVRDDLETRLVIPHTGEDGADPWTEDQPLEAIGRPIKKPNWKPTFDADISSGSKAWRPQPHITRPSSSVSVPGRQAWPEEADAVASAEKQLDKESQDVEDFDAQDTRETGATKVIFNKGTYWRPNYQSRTLYERGAEEEKEKEKQEAPHPHIVDICQDYLGEMKDVYDNLDDEQKKIIQAYCEEQGEGEEGGERQEGGKAADMAAAAQRHAINKGKKKKLKLPWNTKDSPWYVPIKLMKVFRKPRIGYNMERPHNREFIMELRNITDPAFPYQWHMHTNDDRLHSVEIIEPWTWALSGKGVTLAFIDDGVQAENHEWQVGKDPSQGSRFSKEGSYNFIEQTEDPTPPGGKNTTYRHGTRSAGVAAAGINGKCGVGVAHGANVSGIRLLGSTERQVTAAEEAEAIAYRTQVNDIYTCAWGPRDNGKTLGGPSVLVQRAMHHATQKGRDGKGSVYVFASGNGGRNGDNCNFDGYANSVYTMTVAAAKRNGRHPVYGEECAANLVTAWGSGDGHHMRTVDVGGECWNTFGGTSASASMVAGIMALALELRPDLTWRDLQHIAVESATNEGLWHSGRQEGHRFSHKFGFGQIKANRFVQLAEVWKNVGPPSWFYTPLRSPYVKIPVKGSQSDTVLVSPEDLRAANFEDSLEHVTLTVNIAALYRGDISVDLISPSGTRSKMATNRNKDNSTEGFQDWTFMSVAHWGERASGEWKVVVKDSAANRKWGDRLWGDERTGTFANWGLQFFGSAWDDKHLEPLPMPGLKERKNMNHLELLQKGMSDKVGRGG